MREQRDREQDLALDASNKHDNALSIKEVDRLSIERWLNAFPGDMEPGHVSLEENGAFWQETENYLVRRSESRARRSALRG